MPETTPADPVAAALAQIRERNAEVWYYRTRLGAQEATEAAKDDVPRLLAVADAVQKLGDEWDAHAADLDARADNAVDGRAVLMLARAQAHQDCAQALREAISRALLGEEGSDAD